MDEMKQETIEQEGINEEGKKVVIEYDEKSTALNVLSFIFPLSGVYLYAYFGWNDKYPVRAASIGKSAFMGLILQLIVFLMNIYR